MSNRFSFGLKGEVVIARLEGRIHGTYSDEVDTALTHAVAEAKYVILDLEKLEFISSSGLRIFLKLRRELINREGAVAFARSSDSVKEIFDVASFEHLFPITDSIEEALEIWGLSEEK
ncbi:MAG: STAS domain-containing protein [Candidatus Electryonea clarkiae]|nr:STAS domain-containing protein [Candidatus Electryonea clarkiae]MDP8288470.1 STAS domain-containing protein [Candidatus Electryonea clarkiae]